MFEWIWLIMSNVVKSYFILIQESTRDRSPSRSLSSSAWKRTHERKVCFYRTWFMRVFTNKWGILTAWSSALFFPLQNPKRLCFPWKGISLQLLQWQTYLHPCPTSRMHRCLRTATPTAPSVTRYSVGFWSFPTTLIMRLWKVLSLGSFVLLWTFLFTEY